MQDTNASDNLFASWAALRDRMLTMHPDIDQGRMMSADALTYKGKVFAFFSTKGGREGLGCRVGRATDLSQFNLTDWQHLAPFKSKPPMKDWIVIGPGNKELWGVLADHCLSTFRNGE
jgi:hypothetical protein